MAARGSLASQVVFAVVAVAPDALLIPVIFDDAVEVGAGRRKGSKVGVRDTNQNDRLGPEANDLVTLLQQLGIVGRPGFDLIRRGLGNLWRTHEPKHGIQDGCNEGTHRSAQKPV